MADDKMKDNKDAESGEPVQLDKDQQQHQEQHQGGQPERPMDKPGQQGGQPQRPQQQPGQQQGGQQHEGGQKR